jgi:hypothetical protein
MGTSCIKIGKRKKNLKLSNIIFVEDFDFIGIF